MKMFDVTKVERALERIRNAHTTFSNGLYVGHSGGKDSCVVHFLARHMIGESVEAIHTPKVTGFNAVHPFTKDFLYHVSNKNIIHFVPFEQMNAFVDKYQFKCQIDGTRADEFTRTDRSATVIQNGVEVSRDSMTEFTEDGLFGLTMIYPIYDWTTDETWQFIRENEIQVSREYSL